jgi:hypothetical protein
MRFSAALLVKKSAAQLNYISRHNEPALSQIVGTYDGFVKQPTERQIAGNLFADQCTTSPFTEWDKWFRKHITYRRYYMEQKS